MAVIDVLITRFQGDAGSYQAAAGQVVASTTAMNGAMATSSALITGITAATTGVSLALAALASVAVVATAGMAAVALAGKGLIELGKHSLMAAASFGRMEAGLMTVAGSAEEAAMMMERLRDVAQLPGLGLQEAIQGATRLMSAGFDFPAAERAMRGFGNALASVGGGRAELDGVLMALTKIAAKGVVSAEEINQIAERVPQIRGLMAGAFGTANTEELQRMGISAETFILGIITELEKLPRAASTFSNSLENFMDAANTALGSLGQGMATMLIPEIEKVASFLSYLASSGILEDIGNKFGRVLGVSDGGSLLIRFASMLIAALEQMPAIMSAFQAVITATITGAQLLIASAVESFNSFAKSPAGKLLGFTTIATPQGRAAMAMQGLARIGGNIVSRASEIEAGFFAAGASPLAPAKGGSIRSFGGPAAAPQANDEERAQTRILQAIEGNTRPFGSAEAFGGGRLGAMGVTPVELSTLTRGRQSGFAAQLANIIGAEMARMVDERVSDMARYGMLRAG